MELRSSSSLVLSGVAASITAMLLLLHRSAMHNHHSYSARTGMNIIPKLTIFLSLLSLPIIIQSSLVSIAYADNSDQSLINDISNQLLNADTTKAAIQQQQQQPQQPL